MGDIVRGALLLLFTLIVLGFYRIFTRKNVEQRSWSNFNLILLILGAIVGLIWNGLNSRLREEHPYTYFFTLLFFITQSLASFLTYRKMKIGFILLFLTLLLQIPVTRTSMVSYQSQTLLSMNVANYHGKIWDIETGSYVHFYYFDDDYIVRRDHIESIFGMNCIPILILLIYWKGKKESKLKI